MLIKPPQLRVGPGGEGQHWYVPGPSPKAAYETLGANGNWRPTHMGDARKHGYVPSVSMISRLEASPGLVKWQVRQGILSALTHPRASDVTDTDELLRMIEKDSQEQVKQAAATGTAIHAAVEHFFTYGYVTDQYKPYVDSVRRELFLLCGVDEPEEWTVEETVAHPYGYGGRVDLNNSKRRWVVDLKGKEFGPDDVIVGYPEQARQLAAYREATMPDARTANLFMSRNIPGLVKTYEWSQADSEKAWKEFRLLLTFWQVKNGFEVKTGLQL